MSGYKYILIRPYFNPRNDGKQLHLITNKTTNSSNLEIGYPYNRVLFTR